MYGGYFGGGVGIVNLAMLAAVGMTDIHAMNASKSILGIAINGVAAAGIRHQGCDLLAASHRHDRWARCWADISAHTTRRNCPSLDTRICDSGGNGDDGLLLRQSVLSGIPVLDL